MYPKARQEGIWSEAVGDELVIYDHNRQRSHRLNQSAAAVWHHCDGTKSATAMAALLREELNPAVDEEIVLLALNDLSDANLLQDALPQLADSARVTRRQVLRRASTVGAAALLIPIVNSLAAPASAVAFSGSS